MQVQRALGIPETLLAQLPHGWYDIGVVVDEVQDDFFRNSLIQWHLLGHIVGLPERANGQQHQDGVDLVIGGLRPLDGALEHLPLIRTKLRTRRLRMCEDVIAVKKQSQGANARGLRAISLHRLLEDHMRSTLRVQFRQTALQLLGELFLLQRFRPALFNQPLEPSPVMAYRFARHLLLVWNICKGQGACAHTPKLFRGGCGVQLLPGAGQIDVVQAGLLVRIQVLVNLRLLAASPCQHGLLFDSGLPTNLLDRLGELLGVLEEHGRAAGRVLQAAHQVVSVQGEHLREGHGHQGRIQSQGIHIQAELLQAVDSCQKCLLSSPIKAFDVGVLSSDSDVHACRQSSRGKHLLLIFAHNLFQYHAYRGKHLRIKGQRKIEYRHCLDEPRPLIHRKLCLQCAGDQAVVKRGRHHLIQFVVNKLHDPGHQLKGCILAVQVMPDLTSLF
mmetsp:Transcript_94328/g.224673  ORF Transcript_94328/g.224673 Transcript_94328/m.224673 type:complete len:444 (-) Transcript_94328:960-2291(-)